MSLERHLVAEALPGYELGDELGRGAFGFVIAGRHVRLERDVAIKQLSRAVSEDAGVKRRFEAEARLLASLDHPHVIPIYDFVEHEGVCLLVMELLTGGTVSSRLPVSQEDACAIAVGTCAGLHHAHERGVLHRDIKPDNLIFSSSGVLKVTDFGIAKVVGSSGTQATRTGMIVGTPRYLAPEQAAANEPTPATDVYAVGTVLYELLSGRLPYDPGLDFAAALYKRVHEDPNPLPESVAPALRDPIERALSREPSERQQTAEELGNEVSAAAAETWGANWPERTDVELRGTGAVLATEPRPADPTKVAEPATVAAATRVAEPSGAGSGKRPGWLVPAIAVAVVAVIAVVAVVGLGGDDSGSSGSGDSGGSAGGGSAAGSEDASVEIVESYFDAYNEKDFAAAASFFAEEAEILGTKVKGAAEGISAISSYTCKTVPESTTPDGNQVTTVNNLSDLPGEDCGEFDGTMNTIVFTIEDGEITEMAYG